MKLNSLFVVAVVLAAWTSMPAKAESGIPSYITAAIADAGRPPEDKAQDANRKPAEVLAFAGIKPGDKVVDLMPGSGYYTRIFSKIVGPKGTVYALQPVEMDKVAPKRLQSLKTFAGTPAYANVVILVQPVAAIAIPERVDMVWTSQNYHDLHDPFMGSPDMAHINKTIFDALKPGGTFLVLDHAATAGSGVSDTNTLHRIDPAAVKAEVTAAGFEFVGGSNVLRNPEDNHSLPIFDKSIKGKTDKFIDKFRKPSP
jgi:predicted methyltransferase